MFKKLQQFNIDTYFCCIPLATFIQSYRINRQIRLDYDALQTMIDINDDVYKRLLSIGFKNNEANLDIRALIDRAKVCPGAMDAVTVEADAASYMNEQLKDIQYAFNSYELVDKLDISATYDKQHDSVLFTIQSKLVPFLADMPRFKWINTVITALDTVIVVLSFILLTTLF